MPDIFDEVNEDLRAERARRLLQRYGGLLVVAVVLVVAGAGGWQAWKWYQARETDRIATIFLRGIDAAGGPPGEARKQALVDFAEVVRDGGTGYRTLARLREAALKADTGDLAGAEDLWRQVADDSGAEKLLRDLAVLQSVLHQIDAGDPAALAARLKPLASPDNPWHALAEEVQALLDIRQGNKDAARDTLKRLAQDVTAPDGVRGRANGLLARLGE
ncbi:Tetratricopeptide repeat protein [Rhodovastum atsumiense]|uniref:Tetratricopeptide repeat protein n=1 Tax=Rhodovastum atsumiense TaxID=504468 RepID=A0A5M6ITM6_9PROT|nr:tetratricopeptide repeat protein [Rhodovastum atsumiense]KAA5610898.1 tetratricopeptide repeat protein [Rhodovastum atsumiense]CAH2601537.1 Tetratricopeptide repeat protein [Rhodovastum atsumiense]